MFRDRPDDSSLRDSLHRFAVFTRESTPSATNGKLAKGARKSLPHRRNSPRRRTWNGENTSASTPTEICHGKAPIEGTRIPVSVILDNLAAGVSSDEIRDNYPSFTDVDIRASIAYAAELSREEIVDFPKRTA